MLSQLIMEGFYDKFVKCWTFLVLCFAIVFCEESGEIRETTTTNHEFTTRDFIDSFKCNNGKNEDRGSVTLKCSKEDVAYTNITEGDFIRFEYNGVLQFPTLQRKFETGKFCLVYKYNVSQQLSSSENLYKLALCNEERKKEEYRSSKIRKCCKPNQRLDVSSYFANNTIEYKCTDIPVDATQKEWKPAVFDSTSDEYSKHKHLEDYELKDAIYQFGFPNCPDGVKSLNNSKDIWFMLLKDGSVEIGLKFWFKPVWLPVEDNELCLDEVVDHDPSSPPSELDSHKIYHKNQILLFCQIPNFDDYIFHRRLFGGLCVTAAGIVFILLVIYVSIWDKQNLAGWTQFNIFVALFFVVLMEGLRTLFDANPLKVQSTSGCVIIAAVAQYFFFALNVTWTVMCFDLFYMFWKLESTSKTIARYRNRLIGYLIVSWGVPFIIVTVIFYFTHSSATAAMNEMQGVYAFAHRRCSSPIRKLGFQTQGIMFLLNLLFFFLTTALIWKHRRGINPARKKTRSERHMWRSICLFMKLVIVMGITSLTIPADYFFGSKDPLSGISVFLRLVHFIPFLAVLFIFGFNEKNVALVNQKFPRFGKYFGIVACASGSTVSETVNHSRSGNVNHISEYQSSSQT